MKIPKDQSLRYTAYLNYLLGTQKLIENLYHEESDLVNHIVSSKSYQRLTGNPAGDKNRVIELLHNSWLTEILLVGIREYPDLIPLNSPWSPVQAYYAIFSASRAYFMSQGRIVNLRHADTLNALAGDLEIPNSRFPRPWNCVFSGDPKSRSFYLINAPQGITINLCNPLFSPYTTNSWQHFGLFLKTTRKKQLLASIASWKTNNSRKRIRVIERQSVLAGLRPTSIFDALYRIRIRSNYEDIDSFAFGVSKFGLSSDDIERYYDAILSLTDYTLLLFEVLIAKVLRKDWLLSEIKNFMSSSIVFSKKELLQNRSELIAQLT